MDGRVKAEALPFARSPMTNAPTSALSANVETPQASQKNQPRCALL